MCMSFQVDTCYQYLHHSCVTVICTSCTLHLNDLHKYVFVLLCGAKKTAAFYYCNSFVRSLSIMTIFGKYILQ